MQAVMLSIGPEWCALIASGEKTAEVRKNMPKLPTPFKCYIYCTIGPHFWRTKKPRDAFYPAGWECPGNGSIIGEFICDQIREVTAAEPWTGYSAGWNTCLTDEEIVKYAGYEKPVYYWHISGLTIYDKPRTLTEFWKRGAFSGLPDGEPTLRRPPQSWCYVEELSA